MLGDVVNLANNLWFIEGEMPEDSNKSPDPANVLVYHAGDRLYLIDSSVGVKMRDSIDQVLQQAGPVKVFTLLNSHSHLDHICNNDLIEAVQAEEKQHYLSEPGLTQMNAPAYFADLFMRMEEYYDPLSGYQAYRLKFRFARLLRDCLKLLIPQHRVWEMFMSQVFAKFKPVNDSRQTIRPLETLPRQAISIGPAQWKGWIMGDNDVWVLEERGHSTDEVLVYIPEHRLLHLADLTFPLFPTWPDTSSTVIRDALRKSLSMIQAGEVQALTDSHHSRIYRDHEEMTLFLETVLSDHMRFRQILAEILKEQDGLNVAQVYEHFCQRRAEAVVQKYLSFEFPHSPPALQTVMVTSLLEMGYRATGPSGQKRFYQTSTTSDRG